MDASNLLKPALQSGTLRCIGSTTYKEYRQHFEKDRALVRRFQKIDVNEPSVPDAIEILKGLKPYFEDYHSVRYTQRGDQGGGRAVGQLHPRPQAARQGDRRDRRDRRLADAAAGGQRRKIIGVKEIEATVATMARIPPKTVSKSDAEVLRAIDQELKRVVFGQDKAIEALAAAIKLSRAGLREPEKPIGCYLFSGPTGVGKTEVAKQLALLLGVELLRFDMTEYMEQHTVSRLIGAPPGYVGFDQGGLLTDGIDQHPHSRAAARRDREGASGPVQHPAAGHGSRQAHRQQRQAGRLPQRRPDHDHQRRRPRPRQGGDRLRPRRSAKATTRRRSSGCSRPEFRNRLDAVIPFANLLAGGHHQGGGEVRVPARGAARRPQHHHRADARRPITGWPSTATTTSSAPGRWRASSRSTSRSRSPTRSCSAS